MILKYVLKNEEKHRMYTGLQTGYILSQMLRKILRKFEKIYDKTAWNFDEISKKIGKILKQFKGDF